MQQEKKGLLPSESSFRESSPAPSQQPPCGGFSQHRGGTHTETRTHPHPHPERSFQREALRRTCAWARSAAEGPWGGAPSTQPGSSSETDAAGSFLPEKAFPIKISYAEYEQHLTADNMLRATALCQLEEGHDTVVERDITLDNPSITIKVGWLGGPNQASARKGGGGRATSLWLLGSCQAFREAGLTGVSALGQVLDQAKVGKVTKVEASFTNPLDEELRDCILQVEGSDLLAEKLKLQ